MTSSLRGGSQDEWTRVIIRFGDLLPRYPDASLIKPLKVPPPPLLRGDTPEQRAIELLRAYKAVLSFFYGPRPGKHFSKLRTRDLAYERNSNSLIKSAQFFYERSVRPHVWVALSVRSWRDFGPPRLRMRPPALTWVTSQSRYNKFEFLYVDAEEQARLSARMRFSPAHLELIKMYEKMRLTLVHHAAVYKLTEKRVKKIVDSELPNRVYRKLTVRARREVAESQTLIDEAYEQGDFLWG